MGYGIEDIACIYCHHAWANLNEAIKCMSNDSEIRDLLALERTRLANERTFLAYIRTALSLIAGAIVLFQFFASLHAYLAIAWVLVIFGLLVLIFGIYRFFYVRSELSRYRAKPSNSPNQ